MDAVHCREQDRLLYVRTRERKRAQQLCPGAARMLFTLALDRLGHEGEHDNRRDNHLCPWAWSASIRRGRISFGS